MLNRFSFLAGLASLSLTGSPAMATTLSGPVATEASQPIAGALVSLWSEQRNQKETVYTDANGQYVLDTEFTGTVTLRGRSPYFSDQNLPLTLQADSVVEQNLSLAQLASPEEILASLPASAHASQLPFRNDEIRNRLISRPYLKQNERF